VTFDRVLGRADLVLFTISALLTIDGLASAASIGYAWFTWWGILIVLFFVPYGLIVAELGSTWTSEGGPYVWVHAGLGPRAASMTAWLYWINLVYWTPSLYLVFAATFDAIFLGKEDLALQTAIALTLTWLTVGIGIVRLKVSKWIPNVGALVKAAIFVGLGVLAFAALARGKEPANEFRFETLAPRWDGTIAYLPVLVFNVLGFELMSSAGDEMKNPRRDVPLAVVLSGLLVSLLYGLGALGILVTVPLESLSVVTGTWDALEILGGELGAGARWVVLLLGVGFLYACVANIVTWSLGANRVAATAARDGLLPPFLGRLHPRFQTPHVVFVAMGVIGSVLLVGNALLASSTTNVFWMLFKLQGVCFLLSYAGVFPSFVRLRYLEAAKERPYRVPGGALAAWVFGSLCWIFVLAGVVLFFAESPTSEQPELERWILAGETAATLAAGWFLARKPIESEASAASTPV
jgi:amino acid transporter